MQVKSPVTNNCNVTLEDELSCCRIIDAYKRDFDIDVGEYFEYLDTVKIYKCKDTGYRFYFPFSLAGKSKLYKELQKQNDYYKVNLEHQVAEVFFNTNNLVLEIGCGYGIFLQKLQQRGISCIGLEFNEDAVQAGRNRGINILNQDVREHAKNNHETYDIVCYFQVLEHITQVHDFIQASLDTLKCGGKLIIGVPNNNPFLYRYDKYHTLNLPPHHMGLWNKKSLANLTKVFPFQLKTMLVEPLQANDYEHYFMLQAQHLKSRSTLLGKATELLLFNSYPTRIRRKLQKITSRFVQGRNILAVYIKQ
jgi:2-polyprenyl-3-methyl-5-hydroxy-6-metoxy-1,4-benzoquinol methylase